MNLSNSIINEIIDISKKYYGINKVVLFGSRARGDNELKSDIDLAIYCDGDLSLFIEEIENTTHTLLEFDFSDMDMDDIEELFEMSSLSGSLTNSKSQASALLINQVASASGFGRFNKQTAAEDKRSASGLYAGKELQEYADKHNGELPEWLINLISNRYGFKPYKL